MTRSERDAYDPAPNDSSKAAGRHSGKRGRGGAQASLLGLWGFLCTVFGLALSVGPVFSWKASEIMAGFDGLGLHGDTLFVGGMVMMGLGMLRRGQTVIAASADSTQGDSELVEEMATDMVQMRHALDHLQLATGQMQEQMQEHAQSMAQSLTALYEAQVRQPQPQANGGDVQGEAVFRLAASLDKVGAKIEERMKSQFSTLRDRLDAVEAGFQNAHQALEARATEVSFAPAAAPVQAPAAMPVQPMPVEMHDPMQAPMSEPMPAPMPAPVEPPAPHGSLGVLDAMDPESVPAPLPEVAPEQDFTGELRLADVRHDAAAGGQAPAGANPWGAPLGMADQESAVSPEERQRMLAETRLRQSLQNMQRDPGQNG